MTTPIVGIDLGTTNSVVAYTDSTGVTQTIAGTDGVRIVPSAVYFPSGGDPVVGERARQYALLEQDRVAQWFKRSMGERLFLRKGKPGRPDEPFVVETKTWSPEELSALVLRKLKLMAEQFLGEPVTRAVITVPAYFGDSERAATRSAGELAGLEVVQIVNEPTAAAFFHGLDQRSRPGTALIFDLGGGTFDVTIMKVGADRSIEVVATGGDRQLGGVDFDKLILAQMAETAFRETGADLYADPWTHSDALAKAEDVKKELSVTTSSTRPVTAGGRPVMFSMTRARFEELLADTLQDVEDTVISTIEKARRSPGDIDHVLMVGGSSRIPAFQALLARVVGKQPDFSRNLDEDVARGAAILAAKLGGELDPRSQLAALPVPVDAASHSLGITLCDKATRRLYNQVMIPSGTPIPAAAEHMVATIDHGQTQLELELNEGDVDDLEFVRQLGSTLGSFGRPVPEDYPIRVAMEYTADQLVRVKAYDGQTNAFLCELEVQRKSLLSAQERATALSLLSSLKVE